MKKIKISSNPTRQQLKSYVALAISEIREWNKFLISCQALIKAMNYKKKTKALKPFFKNVK